MDRLKFFILLLLTGALGSCSTTTAPTTSNRSLYDVYKVLSSAEVQFKKELITLGDQGKAIVATASVISADPLVASTFVDDEDSSRIMITLTSGAKTEFNSYQMDANGHDLFRGGGNHGGGGSHLLTTRPSVNRIKNKKVLLYMPGYSQFYGPGEIEKVVDLITNSGLGLEVTVLKDENAPAEIVDAFKDYGLVIIDTHGTYDGFLTGSKLRFTTVPKDSAEFLQGVLASIGQQGYNRMLSNEYDLHSSFRYVTSTDTNTVRKGLEVWMKSEHIKGLSDLDNTIIFGNMCFSGQSVVHRYDYFPIRKAFDAAAPLSYYAYSDANGNSNFMGDAFCKRMEDSLVRAFVHDIDSTGIAHLDDNGNERIDWDAISEGRTKRKVSLKHWGKDDYSYENCVDSFIDARDGHVYKAVCIGKQVWMAENLAYDAPGSQTYEDDPSLEATYGRLYDWATMMQGAKPSSATPSGVQGVCPKGWHIPSSDEYFDLIAFLSSPDNAGNDTIVGGKMKAISSLWNTAAFGPNIGATNTTGFSALPGGGYYNESGVKGYKQIGEFARFWMTDEDTTNALYPVSEGFLSIYSSGFFFGSNNKAAANSCRCLKD